NEQKQAKVSWRVSELSRVQTIVGVLNDMLSAYQPSSSVEEKETLKQLYNSCLELRPGLQRIAEQTDDGEKDAFVNIVNVSEELDAVIQDYEFVVDGKGSPSKRRKSGTSEAACLLDLDMLNLSPEGKEAGNKQGNQSQLLEEVFGSSVELEKINGSGSSSHPDYLHLWDFASKDSPAAPQLMPQVSSASKTSWEAKPAIKSSPAPVDQKSSSSVFEDIEKMARDRLSVNNITTKVKPSRDEKVEVGSGDTSAKITPHRVVVEDTRELEAEEIKAGKPVVDATSVVNLNEISLSLDDVIPARAGTWPDLSVAVLTFANKSKSRVSDYVFKAVVTPKTVPVRVLPPDDGLTGLPPCRPFVPPPMLTQLLLASNPKKVPLSLKFVVCYTKNDDELESERGAGPMALFGSVRSAFRYQQSSLILRETVLDSFLWSKSFTSMSRVPYAAALFSMMEQTDEALPGAFGRDLGDSRKKTHGFANQRSEAAEQGPMALFGSVRSAFRYQQSSLILRETVLDSFLWSKSFTSMSRVPYAAALFSMMEQSDPAATPEQAEVWKNPEARPVVVLVSWLLAKAKHIQKHAEIYLKQGFDVITLEIKPYHMLFPEKGAQPLAEELLDYLVDHTGRRPLFLHGFSVGAYFHGELLNKMRGNSDKYSGIERRIRGQVWDSIVDYDHIPIGFPKAVSNNMFLQRALEVYIRCHMKALSAAATKHYVKSSRAFQESPIPVPALFFASHADPVGVAYKIAGCAEKWSSFHGIPTYVKVWKESKHVSHYHMHPKEYQAELAAFLDHLGFLPRPEQVASFHQDKLPTEVSKSNGKRDAQK
ncbi:unnamed protein product, partial [Notodromas monacha]